jgi:phenylalanyl-tRNA synthetase beta subunit
LAFLISHQGASFDEASALLSSLMYYLDQAFTITSAEDGRFAASRQAAIVIDGNVAGFFGELCPEVQALWSLTSPVVCCELDLQTFPRGIFYAN